MKYVVASRLDVEQGIEVEGTCAVISIRNPGEPKPRIQIKGRCVGVLYLEFHDAERTPGIETPKDVVMMKAWHACSAWAFFEEHRQEIDTIVVHCYAGMSRSPALAAAISEACGDDLREFFIHYQPNEHVFHLMRFVRRMRSVVDQYWPEHSLPRRTRIVGPNGEKITSVSEWFRHAPPEKGRRQWKDGRSAKELARRWFGRGPGLIPWELSSLLRSHPETERTFLVRGFAEHETLLDDFPGKGRQHDLLLEGFADGGGVVVGVEAKADEPFGLTIAERLSLVKGKVSNVPSRITNLSRAVFGSDLDEMIAGLRYQLLHALAGTMIEAIRRQVDLAVFVIHEFATSQTSSRLQANNRSDLARFVSRLTNTEYEAMDMEAGVLIDCGYLSGRFDFAPYIRGEMRKPRLLIGKAQADIVTPTDAHTGRM